MVIGWSGNGVGIVMACRLRILWKKNWVQKIKAILRSMSAWRSLMSFVELMF